MVNTSKTDCSSLTNCFNISTISELPTDRATRNLTLMAKTLQTLANFTRFQGKEDFMEFLNDFLEAEAPRMKEFLHQISTRLDPPASETILDWSGYIDQGKQLSILHTLLSESFQKLPHGRHETLNDLKVILDKITKAKETNNFHNQSQTSPQLSQSLDSPNNQENHQQLPSQPQQLGYRQNQRGVIRGVLTPNSLERNIFRYNDPTVSPHLNLQPNNKNQSQTSINGSIYSNHLPLQHSQSTSSISSSSNHNNNSLSVYPLPHQTLTDNQFIPTTVDQYQTHKSHQPLEPSSSVRNYNTTSHFYSSAASPKSQAVRSNTLPRNNTLKTANQVSNIEVYHSAAIDEATDTINANLIQIGLDPSSAFVRKSPTPLLKLGHQPLLNHRMRTQNGSHVSLHSDRTNNASKNALNLNLNLGIPHNDHLTHNPHSNMPMNLEDLDDLLKYGEEHADDHTRQSKHPGGHKEQLTSKGSNASIGVCSSGYQTTTQSPQSSSPVELTVVPTAAPSKLSGIMDYAASGGGVGGRRPMPQMQQISSTPINAKFTYLNNNNHTSSGQSALAFKNPLYKMHNTPASSHLSENSCSLTPSSSEERLSMDNYCTTVHVGNGSQASAKGSEADYSMHSLNGSVARRQVSLGGSNRVPRTNPLMQVGRSGWIGFLFLCNLNLIRHLGLQYKREDPLVSEAFKSTLRDLNNHHHSRYQRRSSMESARTLSDSSTDTEGKTDSNARLQIY